MKKLVSFIVLNLSFGIAVASEIKCDISSSYLSDKGEMVIQNEQVVTTREDISVIDKVSGGWVTVYINARFRIALAPAENSSLGLDMIGIAYKDFSKLSGQTTGTFSSLHGLNLGSGGNTEVGEYIRVVCKEEQSLAVDSSENLKEDQKQDQKAFAPNTLGQ